MPGFTKTAHQLTEGFRTLRNPAFAKLYLAETVSLLDDPITWGDDDLVDQSGSIILNSK